MKFNWKVRFKNPYFWISVVSVILTSINISPAMLTNWSILIMEIENLFSNPFLLFTTVTAVIGAVHDPTTQGLCDCGEVLNKKDL